MSDVSRETELLDRYRDNAPLVQYAEILATRGVERGLVGPREVARVWSRHIANCAVVAEEERACIPDGASVVDVGSGAGLPGVVWALVRPDLRMTLLEPLLRRATFLSEVVAELELDGRVQVVRARAEQSHGQTYDVVTARAVARLPQLLAWTMPLVAPRGWLVALKGAGAAAEVADAGRELERAGAGRIAVRTYGLGIIGEPTTAVLVERSVMSRS